MGRRTVTESDETRLRELHAKGLTDRQIARKLGITLAAAWARRQRLGLPRNVNREVNRQHCREATRRRVKRDGHSMGQLHAGHLRCEAAIRGWFGADSPSQCDILDLLQNRGPMTAAEIRDALGYSTSPSVGGAGNVGLYRLLRKLKTAGLVVKAGVRGGLGVYALDQSKRGET